MSRPQRRLRNAIASWPSRARRSPKQDCRPGRMEGQIALFQRRPADAGFQLVRDVRLVAGALWMSEARCALASRIHVIDDRILAFGVGARRHLVQPERSAYAPGDVVIGTCGVAAHPEPADDVIAVIERQSAAEHDDATDTLAGHRVAWASKGCRVTGACLRRGRAGGDDAVKTLAGLGEGE